MNTPMIAGRQTFDGLGRQLTVETGEYATLFHYKPGQLPPFANTLANGMRVGFEYESRLNNKLLSVSAQGESTQRLTYHPLGMPASASGALGTESFGFTPSGQPKEDIWSVDGADHHTQWQYSMNGLLQGFVDAQGIRHRRRLDTFGRVQETSAGNLITRYRYDALSRLIHISVHDPDNARTLTTSLTYDGLGRERSRTFNTVTYDETEQPVTRTFSQTLGYSALDQLTSRQWNDGGRQGLETFEYDARQRLVRYTANDEAAPTDPFGNRIVEQLFIFNALNGYERTVSTFADGSSDEAVFSYADRNPCQMVKATHTHASWPGEIRLAYDNCGRVISDSLGRSMTWDTNGRLTHVSHDNRKCQYGYTASGHLVDRTLDGTLTRGFFSGDELTHEQTGNDILQFCSGEQGMFAINTLTAGIRKTTLMGTDAQGSVRLEADTAVRTRHYDPHGAAPQSSENLPFGYAGQRSEPLTGWQILGDYRPYDPVLMCFLSPDSESPFGRGGINPYAYCAGDPINRVDPDGHSWVTYALAGIGLAVSITTAVASFGAAAAIMSSFFAYGGYAALTPSAALVIGAAALDLVSLGTGVAALGMELAGADQNAANVLGWISLGSGLASAGLMGGFAGSALRARSRTNAGPATKPLYRQGQVDVLFETSKKGEDTIEVAFHNQLWGDAHLKAFETHGTPDGYLLNAQGVFESAAIVARREIAPRLASYAQHRPLVLLACEGGSSGAAQQVANVLRRQVIGFDEVIYIYQPRLMNAFENQATAAGIATNFPLQQIPFLKRLGRGKSQPYTAGKNMEPATYKIYEPK